MTRSRVLILGAAGRDFHNFNVFFRNRPEYEVVAFTATQIPDIEGRLYPPDLAGPHYPQGIPIYAENGLTELIKKLKIDEAVFSYSDVQHEYVMHRASEVIAAGADFRLMGTEHTMLTSHLPVVAITAVRTGAGKSQTTRKVAQILRDMGKRVVVVRHPMPYGDLSRQAVQRFATYEDLQRHRCTIEEREEYEHHLEKGSIVYAGVDYEAILREAEKEAEVILWDGGNNDLPFYKPNLHLVVLDPHRSGHELRYHPGEANLRRADVAIINKIETANPQDVETLRQNLRAANPGATVIEAASPLLVDHPELIMGKRVLVVEDGPTLTHGEMRYGAGIIAARKLGARELVDPRPYAVGSIKVTYAKYPHLSSLLPAMGYGEIQMRELQETIIASPAEAVVVGTPIDLARLLHLPVPTVRVRYELQEIGQPDLTIVLKRFLGGG
ncbi:MAG: cyclic 2,3-diphosphoglycerate synthase [Firmicutes bacterium]|nr:cyclic 2,3-diphosphoglycerate synthase [Bacillota bacterium]MCL5038765.1 cyclic 2,3-diphosphoglycerate synthase [Bacillota bacterium]